MQKLFTNLGNDTLSFLAGVWAAPIETESSARFDTNVGVQLSALRHAEAFMRAQNGEQDGRQDFQVIIPSLLIALHSEDRYVRDAALSVFGTMSEGSEGTQRASIYAFESLYGGTSGGKTITFSERL